MISPTPRSSRAFTSPERAKQRVSLPRPGAPWSDSAARRALFEREMLRRHRNRTAIDSTARIGLGLGTKKHLRLRRQRAGPIRDELHAWLLQQKPKHPPKSPISTAIRYVLNQWP